MQAQQKWTEIEHLPGWDEDFYDVFTAKKYGKWVMLKALKPQYQDVPRYQKLLEKEFDVRYNLAHPAIVMINDFEEVPGVGMAIITDDVYGTSLQRLIDEKRVTAHHLDQLTHQMVDAMDYIQSHHLVHYPLQAKSVLFTDKIENLKLIDVGFDQHESLTPLAASEDIEAFGRLLNDALDASDHDDKDLRRIANKCISPEHRYRNISSLRMALAGRNANHLRAFVIGFLIVMLAVLITLTLIQK